jgi:hypothetical protein
MGVIMTLRIYRHSVEIVMARKQWRIILRGGIQMENCNKKSLYLS